MNPEKPDSGLKVSGPETFKKLRDARLGRVMELPSGLVVKVGSPHISDMIEAGDIPGELINTALGVRSKEVTDAQAAKNSSRMMKYIISKALIEPKCVLTGEPNYDKGEIHIQDIDDTDRIFIYTQVQEGVMRQLNKFRNDSAGKVGRPDSTPLPGDKAKPADGSNDGVGSVPAGRSTGPESPRRGAGQANDSGKSNLQKPGDGHQGKSKDGTRPESGK